jgi:uncharacterized protein YlzI (FlbEa/FlbD family)
MKLSANELRAIADSLEQLEYVSDVIIDKIMINGNTYILERHDDQRDGVITYYLVGVEQK